MELNETNRLLLMNQFKILSKLEGTNDYDNIIKILENGYEYEYNIFDNFIDPSISIEKCKYVYKILNMFDTLQSSLSRIKTNKITENDVEFKGFDGNNETCYMSYSEFIIEDLKKYTYIKKNEYNSHWPMINTYDTMYNVYKIYNNDLTKSLTEDEICEICYWIKPKPKN